MGTLIENLNSINSYKSDIKTAIENKGVYMEGVPFSQYADSIGQIQGGGGNLGNLYAVQNQTYQAVDYGYDGFDLVEVSVIPNLQPISISSSGTYSASVYGCDGFDTVTVTVSGGTVDVAYQIATGELSLLSLESPSVTVVNAQAFQSMGQLLSVSFPNCFTLKSSAFKDCINLVSAYFPAVANTANTGIFMDCHSLTNVYLDNDVRLGQSMFARCYSLSYIYAPNVSQVYDDTFSDCTSLSTISFPILSHVSARGFLGCGLTSLFLPSFISGNRGAFMNCSSLSFVELPLASRFGPQFFEGCINLQTVILSSTVFCTIYDSTVFANTNSTFTIIVPNDLLNTYQNDVSWSWFASQIIGSTF